MTWVEFQKALVKARLTQAEFSRQTGYAENVVSKWQHRKNGVPRWVRSWFSLYRPG